MTVSLNPKQQIAVEHVEGPLLVLACAGSGKTRVVTHRIARLIDIGILPSDILAVTFTNKAAEEMKTRIRALKNAHVLACTFHSLGARILRESISSLGYRNDFAIYDEEDSEKLVKACFQELNAPEEKGTVKKIRHQISSAKNDLLESSEITSFEDPLFAQIYPLYQQKLKESNAVDFDDLLFLPVKLLRENVHARREYQNRWLFLLIDEYQDTNLAQYHLAKMLVEVHNNLFAVGDPDQSIYSWRGARYQNILNFESDFPGAKVITLDQNYRSTNHILKAANALIDNNQRRYDKNLWSELGDGEKIGVYIGPNDRQEADFVAKEIFKRLTENRLSLNDIAIFYRTNSQSRTFEDALLSHKIPYVIIGGLSFYERREVKDILAFLRMIVSSTDLIAFLRTINLPKRGLGPSTLEKIVDAATKSSIPIFSFLENLLSESSSLIKLSARQKQGLKEYVEIIHSLRNARPHVKLYKLIEETVFRSSYLRFLEEDPETAEDRKSNIDELIGKAAQWEEESETPTLSKFLEELSLRTHEKETALSTVKLMTLHNSKGLEFNTVFLVGLEEGLFPHLNAQEDLESLEEERRLFYVGMTRAKRHLFLTGSTYRFMWGSPRFMTPSRFLKELPSEHLRSFSSSSLTERPIEESAPPVGFSIGERVLHKEFGAGIIQKTYEGTFGPTYEVYFSDSKTTRTLAARYAKLQPYS